MAATGIQLVSALGPSFFGVLRDVFGGYGPPLLIAAVLDVLAAAVVVLGGTQGSVDIADERRLTWPGANLQERRDST